MFGLMMAVQKPKQVATLLHYQKLCLARRLLLEIGRTVYRLAVYCLHGIITQELTTDRMHPRQSQQTEICPK
jgi:hypothetical protein